MVIAAVILPALAAATDDTANDSPFLTNSYTFWLGGFFPNLDSQVRLDSDSGTPGDGLDFEDTLGLEDGKSVLFGGMRWRIKPRHMLEFELIQLNRAGTVAGISESLNIGDYEVQVGARIDTVFDVTIGRMTYGYSAIYTERAALDLKAGLHIAGMDSVLLLSGAVFEDGVPVGDPGTAIDEGGDIKAPLPHFGLSYAYTFTPNVAFRAQALLFGIEFNNYKGRLADIGMDIQYRPAQKFGLGAGFRYFKITVEEQSDSGLRGEFKFEYVGPVIYGTYSF